MFRGRPSVNWQLVVCLKLDLDIIGLLTGIRC